MTAKAARASAAAAFARAQWPRLLIGAGLLFVFFGNAGFRSMVSNWLELRRLKNEIVRLDRDEKELDVRLKALRAGDGGVERAARADLGYIKKGEIEYRFPPPEKKPVRPILFSIGPFHLFGYGAMIVLGGLFSFGFLRTRMEKLGLKGDDDFWILVNVCLASGFLGGRVLYLIEYTAPFSAEFWRTLFSPSQGFSILGDFVSVPLALWLFARWKRISFVRLLDTISLLGAMGHIFGRFGCLLAGCCHGRPTDVPWAITFTDPSSQVPQVWLGVPLHPTQLYEAFGNAVIAFGLYRLLKRTESARPGLVAAAYFASYGVLRFFEEFYRGDTVPLGYLGLTGGQGLGLGLVAFACVLLAWRSACSRPS